MINGVNLSGQSKPIDGRKAAYGLLQSVHLSDLHARSTKSNRSRESNQVIDILPNQLETSCPWPAKAELFQPDLESDLLKIAVVERHRGVKEIGLGVVRGFGLKEAPSQQPLSHDSHN